MTDEHSFLQNAVNGLMSTGSTDANVSRIWSTCPSMLTIHGIKGKAQDNLKYIIDDSNNPLPLSSVLERVQKSSKKQKMMLVTVREQKEVRAYSEDLYAHFLIEGNTHTTHYVSMSKEFPLDQDLDIVHTDVSLRCKKTVSDTKSTVLIGFDYTDKKEEGLNQADTTSVSSEQSTAKFSEISRRTKEMLKTVIKQLLQDGIDTVIVLTNPCEQMDVTSLLEEVKEVRL
jgi:hypothetical protein